MLRKLLPVILVNVLLVVLFVWSNYGIWDLFPNHQDVGYTVMNAVQVTHGWIGDVREDGTVVGVGSIRSSFNFPYWLFFISTAFNLLFITRLVKAQQSR